MRCMHAVHHYRCCCLTEACCDDRIDTQLVALRRRPQGGGWTELLPRLAAAYEQCALRVAALEPAAAEPLAETTCSQLLSVLTAANFEGLGAQDAAACNSINADCLAAAAGAYRAWRSTCRGSRRSLDMACYWRALSLLPVFDNHDDLTIS